MVVDLADVEQRGSVIASAREDPPHYLVNAAAILEVIALADVDEAIFRRHFTVNVEAPWFLCRDIGGVLVEGGAIVNFSSPSARWAYTLETAVYGATKTAVQGVTRSFAIALAPRKVRVNAISPGPPTRRCRRRSSARSRPCAGCRTRSSAATAPSSSRSQVRAALGDGRRGPLAALRCRVLHHRPDDLCRRRLHHVGVMAVMRRGLQPLDQLSRRRSSS